MEPAGRTNPPETTTAGIGEPPPPDGHPVAASGVQEHLDNLLEELHHGPGSHDDPNLPDGPSESEEDDAVVAGGYEVGIEQSEPRIDAGGARGGI